MAEAVLGVGTLIGAVASTTVGKAVIGVGLSLGASYLSSRASPERGVGQSGRQLSRRYETNEAREICFGTSASDGSYKYDNTYGPNGTDYLQQVFVLADHECDGLVDLYVNGEKVTLGDAYSDSWVSGQEVDEYPGCMWVQFHSGAWDQAADPDLVAHNSEFTSDHRGRGLCYVRVTLKFDAEKFANGEPTLRFVIRGAKLYDWRKDTTVGGSGSHRWGEEDTYEWTDNPVVIWYNYHRGIFVNGQRLAGMTTSAAQLPLTSWTAAANACDESVTLKAGGSEKRYRLNGWYDVGTDHGVLRNGVLSCIAGDEVNSGGIIHVLPGVSRSSVLTIADVDLLSNAAFQYTPKLSITSLKNSVFGQFYNPDIMYEPDALAPRISPDDTEEDAGNELSETYSLDYVTSQTQGQRVLEILRRRGRHQRIVTMTLRPGPCALLEAGDWITWTSARYGFDSMKWEVLQATLNSDLTTLVELREISESVFAWNPAEDELDPLEPKPVGPGGASFTTVQDLAVDTILVEAMTGSSRPGLHVTFESITDYSVTDVLFEYRQVGDTVALEYYHKLPTSGSATWVSGVLGGVEYEIRAKPITNPVRATVWTGWVSTSTATGATVVDVAHVAEDVTPGIIDVDDLDEQSRFLLQLAALSEEANYGVAHAVAELRNEVQTLGEAVLSNRIESNGTTANARTAIRLHQTLSESYASYVIQTDAALEGKASAASMLLLEDRVTDAEGEIEAQAAALLAAEAEIDGKASASSVLGLTSRVEETEEGLYYAEQAAYLSITENGIVKGLAGLYGSEWMSYFIVGADKLIVAHPTYGYDSGHIAPFVVSTNQYGAGYVSVNGNIIANGTIYAEALNVATLSAITADLGTVTAGIIRNPENTLIFDLANMRLYRTDGKADIDLKNLRFRFGSD